MYDSTEDTLKHIETVRGLIGLAVQELCRRAIYHDESKLKSPEKEVFDEMTPKLAACTYGSEEYRGYLAQMKPALDHHYSKNSHHPEHFGYQRCGKCDQVYPLDFKPGICQQCDYPLNVIASNIKGMSLLDLLEMLCDWKAATLRHNDGDILRSIEINQKRFGYSDELKQILLNTVGELNLANRPIVSAD